jgi:hypothetical protein
VCYRVFIDSKQGDILLKIMGHHHSPDLIRFFRAFTRFFLRDLYSGPFHVSTGDYICLLAIPVLPFSTTTLEVSNTCVYLIQVES